MQALSSESYLKVPYDLRPSKQVERRMFLDFFRRMSSCGVAVEEFRYTGMGSIHFVDHILFHKFLGIDRLVSVERDQQIEDRVLFNRPYANIEVEIMDIGDYIPQLDLCEKHIVWMDYDHRLSEEILDDVQSCSFHLSEGSFIFVTVDTEPSMRSDGAGDNYRHLKAVCRGLWRPSWTSRDFTNERLHWRVLEILGLALQEGVAGRPGVSALPCFSVVYADGHQMATIGVQVGGDSEAAKLRRVKDGGAGYMVTEFGAKPYRIEVPVLTRKERLCLQGVMPSGIHGNVRHTGVNKQDFERFLRVYRFLPSYAELLLG